MHLYDKWSTGLDVDGAAVRRVLGPGRLRLPTETGLTLLADFRADPVAHRLGTPSGRIEIFSATSTRSATTTAPATRRGSSPRVARR